MNFGSLEIVKNDIISFSDGSVMKTYAPGMTKSLFGCQPAGIDTKKDFWSPKCGWGCGQGQDSKSSKFEFLSWKDNHIPS